MHRDSALETPLSCEASFRYPSALPAVEPSVTPPMLRLIGNLLWLFFGGLESALGWFIACAICAITIVGIPWARACFNIGLFSLWPFGSEAVDRRVLYGEKDLGTGVLGVLGNIVWFIVAGWWLAVMHMFFAMLMLITIVGIPFAVAHWKLAGMAVFPIGKAIVPKSDTYKDSLRITPLA